ncbi:hypothetical protein EGT51_12005 [Levilactobacillus suantsaiihabitans]|uniref:Uncharacterized protein n=1 Tax=Levilactobacillus suantsaiihabitans TaxID=2487722 RepID=A0A4Z0J7I8_9LACO|nr:hypothetical protein EGT51_12005 [Levilactobacillus suantsaiihabitans]
MRLPNKLSPVIYSKVDSDRIRKLAFVPETAEKLNCYLKNHQLSLKIASKAEETIHFAGYFDYIFENSILQIPDF